MKSYFIVGTDTDCGKTYVTCQLVRYLQEKQQRVIAIKPVSSGCSEQAGELISDDVLQLQQYNGENELNICPWRFKLPIAPHLAAAASGQRLSTEKIADFCSNKAFADHDYVLVEGAGGLMVPLNDHETWIDFLIRSQMPVILVVGMRLGCINHALLTAFVLNAHQIPCVGWIANCMDKDMQALDENIQTLAGKIVWPLLATIPYAGTLTGERVWTLF